MPKFLFVYNVPGWLYDQWFQGTEEEWEEYHSALVEETMGEHKYPIEEVVSFSEEWDENGWSKHRWGWKTLDGAYVATAGD